MKQLIIILFLFSFIKSQGTTYYLSAAGNNSLAGTSTGAAWQTVAKINSSAVAGDSIVLRRGDVFTGRITVAVKLGAYGAGANPKISGMTNLTGWTLSTAGIYKTTLAARPNVLTINSTIYGQGRFPNSGYLTIASHTSNTITVPALTGTWTTGEVVIKKTRWVMDVHSITTQTGVTTLTYAPNPATGYTVNDGFGMFIQNSLATLDQFGEWFYNSGTSELYVYFGGASPGSYVVNAASNDKLYQTTALGANVTFNGVDFEGANGDCIELSNGSNFTMVNCNVTNSNTAFYAAFLNGAIFKNCKFNTMTNNGIVIEASHGVVFQKNYVSNVHQIAGAGGSGDGNGFGMIVKGYSNLIDNNTVNNIGYIPVNFEGGSNTISDNLIYNFGNVKDDAGGIYTFNNHGSDTVTRRVNIFGNHIFNGVGAGAGTDAPSRADAHGIYADDNVDSLFIYDNTLHDNGSAGLFFHNAHELTAFRNTIYNNGSKQLWQLEDNLSPNHPRNNRITRNVMKAKAGQKVLALETYTNDLNLFGVIDSNYYSSVDASSFHTYDLPGTTPPAGNDYSFAAFKSVYGKDAATYHKAISANANTIIKPKIIREVDPYSITDRNKSRYLFDANGGVDPANAQFTFPGNTGINIGFPGKQIPEFYREGLGYPGRRGNRVVVDLTGAKDMNDMSRKVQLKSMYGYAGTFDAGDTVYIYNFDNAFDAPVDQRWRFLARPDSMLIPIGYLVTQGGGTAQWTSTAIDVPLRYVLLRTNLRDRGGYKTSPIFSELVCYGTELYDTTATVKRPLSYTGGRKKKGQSASTYGFVVGENQALSYPSIMQYDGRIREYGATVYWAALATASTLSQQVYTYDNFASFGPTEYAQFKAAGKKVWWSIKGQTAYHLANNIADGRNNIDPDYYDFEDPYAYTWDADFYYNYAAVFGAGNVPTANTKFIGAPGNNLNLFSVVENGNEELGHGASLPAFFMRTNADFDGYEGRYGNRFGIKNADPSFHLMMAGTVFPDSLVFDNMAWFGKIFRNDRRVPLDEFNFHMYPGSTDTLDRAADIEDIIGAQSLSGEALDVPNRIKRLVDAIHNYTDGDTSLLVNLTEYGRANFGTSAKNTTEAGSIWEQYNTHPVPGRDSLQQKAVLNARDELMMPFLVDGYNEFFFHNSTGGDNSTGYALFNAYGRLSGHDNSTFMPTVYYPAWYTRAAIYTLLKNYYPDTVFSYNTTKCLIRYRKVNASDSVCYVQWKGSMSGSNALLSQTIATGSLVGGTARKVIPSFTTVTGFSSIISAANSIIDSAMEMPSLYFAKEAGGAANVPPVADAGPDLSISLLSNVVQLNGGASVDPDGTIASYAWTKVSGPAYTINNAAIVNPTVTLQTGSYLFRLTVTDNLGATSTDDVIIVVFSLPVNTLTLPGHIIFVQGG